MVKYIDKKYIIQDLLLLLAVLLLAMNFFSMYRNRNRCMITVRSMYGEEKEFRFNISDWNETKQDVEEFQYGFDPQRFNESNESVP